jgi:hypothetical protein
MQEPKYLSVVPLPLHFQLADSSRIPHEGRLDERAQGSSLFFVVGGEGRFDVQQRSMQFYRGNRRPIKRVKQALLSPGADHEEAAEASGLAERLDQTVCCRLERINEPSLDALQSKDGMDLFRLTQLGKPPFRPDMQCRRKPFDLIPRSLNQCRHSPQP